jgi:hypothetical protein
LTQVKRRRLWGASTGPARRGPRREKVSLAARVKRDPDYLTSCRHPFALRLMTPHGALAFLRGRRQAAGVAVLRRARHSAMPPRPAARSPTRPPPRNSGEQAHPVPVVGRCAVPPSTTLYCLTEPAARPDVIRVCSGRNSRGSAAASWYCVDNHPRHGRAGEAIPLAHLRKAVASDRQPRPGGDAYATCSECPTSRRGAPGAARPAAAVGELV